MKRRIALVLMTAWVVAIGAGLASAQPAPSGAAQPAASQPQPGQESPDQFVPVTSLPVQDQIPASNLVMAAYAFVWAALLVYVWTVWRRLMKVEQEMRDLSSRLGQKR
jgi:CcmD family protein